MVIILILQVFFQTTFSCGYMDLQKEKRFDPKAKLQEIGETKGFKSSTWVTPTLANTQPVRLTTAEDTTVYNSPESATALRLRKLARTRIMPIISDTIKSLLRVIPSSIAADISEPGYCNESGISSQTFRYENTDFLLIWGIFENSSSGTIAYAYPCGLDISTRRYIIGYTKMNAAIISSEPAQIQGTLVTMIHELFHALGLFNDSATDSHRDPTTGAGTTNSLIVTENGVKYFKGP